MTDGTRRTFKGRGLFFKAKNPRLARVITITSPTGFRQSIRTLKRKGITLQEKRALVLAQNRARAQLRRRNLSRKERRQFTAISKIKLPKITRRKK